MFLKIDEYFRLRRIQGSKSWKVEYAFPIISLLILVRRFQMYSAPTHCPVCRSELTVTRLHCPACDTSIEGQFSGGPFAHLTAEHLDFIVTFVRCEGRINRMEQELGLSYPTIRNRLHEVIRALGFEPGKDEVVEIGPERRSSILADLEAEKISAAEAMRLLRGEEE
jgi:hypothetical protein